ncbi:TraB/GumN family protein [Variovorax robiniae]|uniref:TraB/GumN family protein n=1 Tax=Variovorax robiniae TaxID=1836199 RepID=A0ABU8X8M2_9BURK
MIGRLLLAAACALFAAAPAGAVTPAKTPPIKEPPIVCPPPPQVPTFVPGGAERAAKRASDRGVLWRIERDGRVSWLYGTLHLGKPTWLFPGPKVTQALEQSDTVALELDLSDPETLRTLLSPPDPGSAARVLTSERLRRIERQRALACLPSESQRKLRPVIQVAALGSLSMRADGLYPEFGIEGVLAGIARGAGKPVIALETAAGQLRMLEGDSEAEQAEDIDASLEDLERGEARASTVALADAWARSDAARLETYFQWCKCVDRPDDKRRMRRYLDDRNPGLADGIATLHKLGQRVFGAVGALHMIGPNGLPALMAARGFTVTRVVPEP